MSEKKGKKSFYYRQDWLNVRGFILFTLMILLTKWLQWTTGLFFIVEVYTALQRMGEAKRLLGTKDF